MGVRQRYEWDHGPLSSLVSHIFHQHVTEQLPLDMIVSAFMTVCEFIMKYKYSLHV